MTKIFLNGCCGRMGQVISKLVKDRDDCTILFGVDIRKPSMSDYPVFDSIDNIPEDMKADVIIDFSHPSVFRKLVDYAKSTKTPIVAATTGIAQSDMDYFKEASSEIAIFHSANMSLGICLLKDLVKKAAVFLGSDYDIEIIEKHHNQKLDAPSGTALAIADAINQADNDKYEYIYDRHSRSAKRSKHEIGISAVRGGNIVGDHEVLFIGGNEIIEITHKAASRDVFADGAIKAALFIAGKPEGFYNMESML